MFSLYSILLPLLLSGVLATPSSETDHPSPSLDKRDQLWQDLTINMYTEEDCKGKGFFWTNQNDNAYLDPTNVGMPMQTYKSLQVSRRLTEGERIVNSTQNDPPASGDLKIPENCRSHVGVAGWLDFNRDDTRCYRSLIAPARCLHLGE